MIVVSLILFVINFICALGIRFIVDNEGTNPYLKSKGVRIVLLIPPVSICILIGTFLFAVLYTLWVLFKSYLD